MASLSLPTAMSRSPVGFPRDYLSHPRSRSTDTQDFVPSKPETPDKHAVRSTVEQNYRYSPNAFTSSHELHTTDANSHTDEEVDACVYRLPIYYKNHDKDRSKETTQKGHQAAQITSDLGSADPHLLSSLYGAIERLKSENESLQRLIVTPLPSRWEALHRVICTVDGTRSIFLDIPSLLSTGKRETHLQGRLRISDVKLYCEHHADIAFLVYKDYTCDDHGDGLRKERADYDHSKAIDTGIEQDAYKSGESLVIVSHILCKALNEVAMKDIQRRRRYPDFDLYSEVQGPYLFYYHDRAFFEQEVAHMREDHRKQLNLFTTYANESFGKEYKEVDELFALGLVSARYVMYLFVPNTILISHIKDQHMAHVLESWPEWRLTPVDSSLVNQDQGPVPEAFLEVSSWEYNGSFRKITTELEFQDGTRLDGAKPIRDLKIYPLRYAEPKVEKLLRDRGRKFWQCRSRNYVCYSGLDNSHEEDSVRIHRH